MPTYSKVSNKRTVFNNRTGGDIILQKVLSQLGPRAFPIALALGIPKSPNLAI